MATDVWEERLLAQIIEAQVRAHTLHEETIWLQDEARALLTANARIRAAALRSIRLARAASVIRAAPP